MLPKPFLKQLQRIVGPAHVSAGRADAEVYSYDGSLAVGAPDAIVFPATTAETAAVVRAAAGAGVPFTPRGFGTNLSGGSVAPQGGLVLCFSRMNRILAIQPERRTAVVQPGLTNLELQNALAPLGFYFAPDPASQKVATLGGNVGENSGGPHCLKYGVTTNHILGLEVVLPDGEVVRVGGPALDPPGYDLRGVLIGSEGTFALVTEATVRILPRPESVAMLLAIYESVADAARSVSGIIAAGIVPATLEMMDATVMRAVEESIPCGYPMDAAAVLIIEVEGPAAGLKPQSESIREVCMANGCRTVREARDAAERDRLWAGRRGAFGAIARIAPNFLVADCTVPRTRLPEALARGAEIAQRHGLKHGNVFHAGDGNLHPLLFFDSRDPEQVRRVHEAGHEIIVACVGLGGTITGEHGVGMEKLEAMRLIFSEADLAFQRTLRDAFDPRGLLNPGKAIPDAERDGGNAECRMTNDESMPNDPMTNAEKGGHGVLSFGIGHLGTDSSFVIRHSSLAAAPQEGWIPADGAEAREIIRTAISEAAALLPVGGGRRADFGNLSDRELVLLRSEKLAAVIEYDPANQVITVGAGMRLATLQDLLAAHNQWLPLRPPLADGCTLGGVVALGACGPERLAYGAPRDRLLGLKFISGTGQRIAAGGRVVKNVAGYDVTRLLAGSAGTLGFLTEVTLRVALRPEVCRAIRAWASFDACAAAAAELLRSNLEPAFVTAAPQAAAGNGPVPAPALPSSQSAIGNRQSEIWELSVGFEGLAATVAAQAERCATLLRTAGLSGGWGLGVGGRGLGVLESAIGNRQSAMAQSAAGTDQGEGDAPAEPPLRDADGSAGASPSRLQADRDPERGESAVGNRQSAGEDVYGVVDGPHTGTYRALFASDFLLRADLPLDRSAGFVSEAHEALSGAGLLLDFGCGRVVAGLPSLSDETWVSLCGLAARSEGHLVLEKAPADFKTRHDVFGPARPDWTLTHRLKAALDPHGVFAPGRLPGRK